MFDNTFFYIADISETWQDFPEDGDPAIIVYFEGCSHNCPGCQNPENQKRNPEHKISLGKLIDILSLRCQKWKTRNLVFSGGDPFYHENPEDLEAIMTLISICEEGEFKVCVYTGYEIDNINEFYRNPEYNEYFVKPSYIKTGPFIQALYETPGQDNTGITLASKNQAFWRKRLDIRTEYEEYIPYSSGNRLEYSQN